MQRVGYGFGAHERLRHQSAEEIALTMNRQCPLILNTYQRV